MDDTRKEELRRMIRAGDKTPAVKLLRELTGLGLAEAKAAVDRIEVEELRTDPPAGG